MAGDAQSGVNVAGIMPVHITEGPAQPILISRHYYNVHMVGHQTIGPNLNMRPFSGLGEQIEIERLVAVLKKCPLPPNSRAG